MGATIKGGSSDPRKSQEAYDLQTYKGQIESICNLLDFGTNLQRVKPMDIDEWESELRDILRGIKQLRNTADIGDLLESSDAVQKWITSALDNLYVASDILQKKGKITVREREQFYEKLRVSSRCLAKVLEYFL